MSTVTHSAHVSKMRRARRIVARMLDIAMNVSRCGYEAGWSNTCGSIKCICDIRVPITNVTTAIKAASSSRSFLLSVRMALC